MWWESWNHGIQFKHEFGFSMSSVRVLLQVAVGAHWIHSVELSRTMSWKKQHPPSVHGVLQVDAPYPGISLWPHEPRNAGRMQLVTCFTATSAQIWILWHVKRFGVRWWDCLSARVIVLETEPQWGCGSSRIKRCHCKALTFGHMSCGADINTISTSIFEPKGQKIRSAPPHPVFHGMILPMLTLVQEGINVLYEETVWSGISEVSWISKIIKERCELKERSSVTDKKFGIQLLHMSPEPTQK